MKAEATARVRIWDLPTRIFHWAVVALIPLMWWTAEEEMMDRHRALGCALLGLLVFRLAWGLIGSSTARFANFLKGPRGILSYLNGRAVHVLGHNPIGGLSVVAMLGALAVQIGLGLFAGEDDGSENGPLAPLIGFEAAEEIADLHEDFFNVLLVLIGIHLAAILFYALIRRKNLVGPMLTGRGEAPRSAEPMAPAPAWRFVIAAMLGAGAALWMGARL